MQPLSNLITFDQNYQFESVIQLSYIIIIFYLSTT